MLSDVLKELDCTELIDAQETSMTRVVSWGSWVLLDDLLRPLRLIAGSDWYSLCDSTLCG